MIGGMPLVNSGSDPLDPGGDGFLSFFEPMEDAFL